MAAHPKAKGPSPLQVFGQQFFQLIKGVGQVSAELGYRPFGAPAEPIPHLHQGVLGGHKQHKGVFWPVGQKKGHCPWLIETGEIPKITVLTEGKLHIGVVFLGQGSRYHCGCAT